MYILFVSMTSFLFRSRFFVVFSVFFSAVVFWIIRKLVLETLSLLQDQILSHVILLSLLLERLLILSFKLNESAVTPCWNTTQTHAQVYSWFMLDPFLFLFVSCLVFPDQFENRNTRKAFSNRPWESYESLSCVFKIQVLCCLVIGVRFWDLVVFYCHCLFESSSEHHVSDALISVLNLDVYDMFFRLKFHLKLQIWFSFCFVIESEFH